MRTFANNALLEPKVIPNRSFLGSTTSGDGGAPGGFPPTTMLSAFVSGLAFTSPAGAKPPPPQLLAGGA